MSGLCQAFGIGGGGGEQMIRFDAQLTVTYVRVKDGGRGQMCLVYILHLWGWVGL